MTFDETVKRIARKVALQIDDDKKYYKNYLASVRDAMTKIVIDKVIEDDKNDALSKIEEELVDYDGVW